MQMNIFITSFFYFSPLLVQKATLNMIKCDSQVNQPLCVSLFCSFSVSIWIMKRKTNVTAAERLLSLLFLNEFLLVFKPSLSKGLFSAAEHISYVYRGLTHIMAHCGLQLPYTSLFQYNEILSSWLQSLCDLTFIFWLLEYAYDVSPIWFILKWLLLLPPHLFAFL